MSWLTQTQRFLQSDLLPEDQLIPLSFSGTETLSQPFNFTLQLVSDDTAIEPKHVLAKPTTLTINPGSR
ncbi:MAG TPA: hypothetical protein VHE99_08910, partial [Gammaproteobacteria bacterium]|nr:hypothetical protein [Gammaproteobacteria bacterium]